MVHVWVVMALAAAAPCKSGQWDRDVLTAASIRGDTMTLEVRVANVAPASNRNGTDAMVATGIPQASLVRGDGCVLSDEEALELATSPDEKSRLQGRLNKGTLQFRLVLGALAAGVFGAPAALFVVGAGLGALVGLVQMAANGNAMMPVQDLLVGGFIAGGVGLVLGLAWLVAGLVVIPLFFKDKDRREVLQDLATRYNQSLTGSAVVTPVLDPLPGPVEPPPPPMTEAPPPSVEPTAATPPAPPPAPTLTP